MREAAEALPEQRSQARWRERRPATLRSRGRDWRALSVNLSCGGVMIAVEKGAPRAGDAVTVTLRLEHDTVALEGVIRHVRKAAWGSMVGVEFDTVGQSTLAQILLGSLW